MFNYLYFHLMSVHGAKSPLAAVLAWREFNFEFFIENKPPIQVQSSRCVISTKVSQ